MTESRVSNVVDLDTAKAYRLLDRAAAELHDLDPWKWACVGIGERMAESIGLSPCRRGPVGVVE